MNKIIPVGQFLPYTLGDLSVVIPQASQYVKRIKWFIPQYIKMTPPEVVKNTLVVYDKGDMETYNLLLKHNIKGKAIQYAQSTYKQEAGFMDIKTRLCVRMHNDTFFIRNDWAETLVDIFNSSSKTTIIGAFNISGGISKKVLDRILFHYPCFQTVYDNLEFSQDENPTIGAPFLGAFFMASLTYAWQSIYPLVIQINEGQMDKEDVVTTLLFSIMGVIITNWNNMFSFVKSGVPYGDFEEGFVPSGEQFIVTPENKANFPKAEYQTILCETEFKEIIYG